jgi:hypothetical protein
LEIVEQGNINAISVESNLYDRIVLAQLNDEGVQLMKQKLAEKTPNIVVSTRMQMRWCGLSNVS